LPYTPSRFTLGTVLLAWRDVSDVWRDVPRVWREYGASMARVWRDVPRVWRDVPRVWREYGASIARVCREVPRGAARYLMVRAWYLVACDMGAPKSRSCQ
jgi:hypothetical protein